MNNHSSPTSSSALLELLELRDASGLLQHSISTQQGALHGALQSFDSAGQTLQRAAYQNGARHGLSEYYNGPLPQMQQNFANGIAHGPTKLFDTAGNLAAELTYVVWYAARIIEPASSMAQSTTSAWMARYCSGLAIKPTPCTDRRYATGRMGK